TVYTFDPVGDSISVSGNDHGSFNSSTHVEALSLSSGATFSLDMDDGTYNYAAPSNVGPEVILFTLADRDGDSAFNSLTIQVSSQDHHPIVRDDHVITNISGGNGTSVVVPDYALLFNDSDPEGQAIAITAISNINSANSVTHASGNVIFVDNNTDGG